MSRLDNDEGDHLSCHSEFTPFGYELAAQQWYWPHATKETLAAVMQGHPTGSFAVRDASTPGHYTLTVRVAGANKLVKILVVAGRVGFTPRTLDFDSVVDLVDYYRHCSLEEHNETLRTSLRFPLQRDAGGGGGGGGDERETTTTTRASTSVTVASSSPTSTAANVESTSNGASPTRSPSQRRRPTAESVADEPLIPARVSRTIAEAQKSGVKVDEEQRSNALVLRHLLEGLVAGACRTQRRHSTIQQQLEALEAELEQHTRALRGYASVETLLGDNRALADISISAPSTLAVPATTSTTTTTSDDDRDAKVGELLAKSVTLHVEKLSRIEIMKTAATTSAADIKQLLDELRAEDATITRRLAAIKEHCARYTNELLACGVDRVFIERTHIYIQRATCAESDALLQSLLRVTLVTSPFDWLTTNARADYATNVVRTCVRLLRARRVARTDGVFLIRPSSKRANCYALVISAGDAVFNCLIENREPAQPPPPPTTPQSSSSSPQRRLNGGGVEAFGYAFANTHLFYATLCDFVRYYSLVTLREHNEQLDTVLRIPALRYLAAVTNCHRSSGARDDHERDEAALLAELRLDAADRRSIDDNDETAVSSDGDVGHNAAATAAASHRPPPLAQSKSTIASSRSHRQFNTT